MLVDNGANINDPGGPNCEGITPLIDAAMNGHEDIVRFLVERGADLTIKDMHVSWLGLYKGSFDPTCNGSIQILT